MSFIYEARRWSGNVNDKIRNLSNKFAQYVTSQISQEGEDITIVTEGRLAEDILKYCDEDLNYGKMLDLPPANYPPEEPDGDKCKLYIHGDGFGRTIPDLSMFNHHFNNRGIFRIQRGIDIGNGGSYELVFDGRSCSPWMPHHADFAQSTLTVGFSILFRFMPFKLSQTGGVNQTILCKKEDANHFFTFDILPDGRLFWLLRDNNVVYPLVTPAGLITANYAPHYEVVATFDHATNTPKLYVNNVLYTTTDNGITYVTSPDTHFKLGNNSALVTPPAGEEYPEIADSKLYCGTLQFVKFWRDKVLTAQQVGYHYTNKLTIANIAFGQVAYPGQSFAGS